MNVITPRFFEKPDAPQGATLRRTFPVTPSTPKTQ